MKQELQNEITKELDNIYGIEGYKEEILNYNKYLEIKKDNDFANCNIMINSDSEYTTETIERLIDFICKALNKNNINIEENCCFLDSLIQQPFYIVKSKIINILFVCKLNNITSITDKVVEEYFKPLIEEKKIKKECKEEKKKY